MGLVGGIGLISAMATAACSGDYTGSPATGGAAATTGGASSTGGQASTGGSAVATGGSSSTGGATGGTAPTTGGSSSTGGQTAATGGSGGAVSCPSVTPCAGDVVATWTAKSSCLKVAGPKDLSMLGIGCMTAPVTGSLQVTGTWTTKGDGTYTDNTTTTGEEQITLAPACLNISGTITTCDRVGNPLTSLGYESVNCIDAAGGGCTCVGVVRTTGGMAFPASNPPASGTYTISGNVATATDGRNEEKYSYCVSGNTLTLTPQSTTTTGTVVLEKP